MRHGLPSAARGQAIGLLGGSFDPAHEGHVRITRAALQRFGLDAVWWLVSPGNPLKANNPASLSRRMRQARSIMRHPRVVVSDAEARLHTRFTAETIRALRTLHPGVRFVWLMGADNLVQFDQWQDWRWIMETVPIGVLARPGESLSARRSRAAQIYGFARLRGRESQLLPHLDAPAWCFLNLPMSDLSSSEIRAQGLWQAEHG